jgi:heme oxygenase
MDTLIELRNFYEKMVQYKKVVREWAQEFITSNVTREKIQSLRTELQRTYSRLEKAIASYGGKSSISDGFFGGEQNVFDVAFNTLDIFNFSNQLDVTCPRKWYQLLS